MRGENRASSGGCGPLVADYWRKWAESLAGLDLLIYSTISPLDCAADILFDTPCFEQD